MKIDRNELNNIFFFIAIYLIMSIYMCVQRPNNLQTITFYLQFCFFSLAGAYIGEVANREEKRGIMYIFLFISIFTLFFFFAYRDGTAIDDRNYRNMFLKIQSIGPIAYYKYSLVEPGYIFILYLIQIFTTDYFVVQIVTAAIPLWLILVAFIGMRNKINLSVATFLLISTYYFQMLSTNLSRMFIAISIIIYGLKFLFSGNKMKFNIAVFVSCLFHFSAAFMYLFSFLLFGKSKLKNKMYLFVLYLSIPIVFILISRFIAPLLGQRHNMYTEIKTLSLSGLFGCLDKLPGILIFWYFKRFAGSNISIRDNVNICSSIYSFSLVFDISSLIVSLGRLTYYTDIFYVIGISMVYKNIRSKRSRLFLLILIVVQGMLDIYITQFCVASHAARLFPYNNTFFSI